ncbi:MAG: WGR domain-containing protein [Thermonemataceae bacterium]|nr:WGR domain-containing protein [Thermonemataceae bacterium]
MKKTIYLELSEEQGVSHKFYEVVIEEKTVHIRYGRIGTDGTKSSQSFGSEAEALKFGEKKASEKKKKGYAEAVMGERKKRSITRRQIDSKPSSAKKSPLLWRFQSGSSAFGIFIDENAAWIGNEAGNIFRLNHQGEVQSQFKLPDGVKCIVGDNSWVYVGCDDGNVYDLTGKVPRLAYEINENVDILWLDISNGLLAVSDSTGKVTGIDYEDEEQWSTKGAGTMAWMVRCDEQARIFYGDSAGMACYHGYDGTQTWYQKTGTILFGWQEKERVYGATSDAKIHVFDKNGKQINTCHTDAAIFSCATSPEGKYIFAADNCSSIYCFNEAGERLWKLASGCGSAFSMQYFQEKIYIVTTDGSLACIDASEEAIQKAQEGILPEAKDIKAPQKEVAISQTTDLETVTNDKTGVILVCVKDGGKLRMKVESQGYKEDWYVQFPKNLRIEGAYYLVDEIKEATQGGFYRTYGNIYKLKKD